MNASVARERLLSLMVKVIVQTQTVTFQVNLHLHWVLHLNCGETITLTTALSTCEYWRSGFVGDWPKWSFTQNKRALQLKNSDILWSSVRKPFFRQTISFRTDISPDKKKFALNGSESFKACFELYRCLNPEKSFKSSFKKWFLSFFFPWFLKHDVLTCSWSSSWVSESIWFQTLYVVWLIVFTEKIGCW